MRRLFALLILESFLVALLVPRPQVRTIWLIGTGFGLGVLQFGFLYVAMEAGMPPGLASLVLQAQAPFTMLLAALLLGGTGLNLALPQLLSRFVDNAKLGAGADPGLLARLALSYILLAVGVQLLMAAATVDIHSDADSGCAPVLVVKVGT